MSELDKESLIHEIARLKRELKRVWFFMFFLLVFIPVVLFCPSCQFVGSKGIEILASDKTPVVKINQDGITVFGKNNKTVTIDLSGTIKVTKYDKDYTLIDFDTISVQSKTENKSVLLGVGGGQAFIGAHGDNESSITMNVSKQWPVLQLKSKEGEKDIKAITLAD